MSVDDKKLGLDFKQRVQALNLRLERERKNEALRLLQQEQPVEESKEEKKWPA